MVQTHMQLESSENTFSLPVFTTTPYGVSAHLPIFQVEIDSQVGLMAILSATRADCGHTGLVGLVLRPCTAGLPDPLRPLYSTGDFLEARPLSKFHVPVRYRRLVDISISDWNHTHVRLKFKSWKDVYIVPGPKHPQAPPSPHSILSLLAYHKFTPFRLPQRYLRYLEDEGFNFRWIISTTSKYAVLNWLEDKYGNQVPVTLTWNLKDVIPASPLYLSFGRCFRDSPRILTTNRGLGRPWLSFGPTARTSHDCTTDHVDGGWPHLTKKWVFDHRYLLEKYNLPFRHASQRYYTISLSPCLVNPDTAYVIHLTTTKNPPTNLRELELYKIIPSMSHLVVDFCLPEANSLAALASEFTASRRSGEIKAEEPMRL